MSCTALPVGLAGWGEDTWGTSCLGFSSSCAVNGSVPSSPECQIEHKKQQTKFICILMEPVTVNRCSWQVPPSVGLSHAWLAGVREAGAASQGSVRESRRGGQGLDALEDEGGAIQGLLITGVLECTAVKRDAQKTQKSVVIIKNIQTHGIWEGRERWYSRWNIMFVCLWWTTHLQSPKGQRWHHWLIGRCSKGH